jgi:segregation and condensation protein B
MDLEKLKSIIESLLFISGEPIKISKLVKITGTGKPEVENAIMVLIAEYEAQKKGIVIIKKGDDLQMATSSENAIFTDQLVKGELQESLSSAALEVLSIVAYRGPITRADIEAIRGVNSSFTLRNLLLRGLLSRKENPHDARSYIYEITFEFLKHLGVDDINKLPDYETLSKDERIDSITSFIGQEDQAGHEQTPVVNEESLTQGMQ